MKRFFLALALCVFLLITGLVVFLPYTQAETNPIAQLLLLPAPPPPNPLFKQQRPNYNARREDETTEPPRDDAPIEEIIAYWSEKSESFDSTEYTPKPSEKTVERIMAEIEKNPENVGKFLEVLPETPELIEKAKRFYDTGLKADDDDDDRSNLKQRKALKTWLTNHSDYFSDDLLKTAMQVRDDEDYVTNQEELLALAHVDWEKARPIVERLYANDSQPISQTLARWALYKHALEKKDSGDTDKYRDELKKAVEDRSAVSGKRDLAMDALVTGGEWGGRDEWYFSLLGDETLFNMEVNGRTFTGLTTLINLSSPDKYKDKMIELTRSSNIAVRSAAVRNLTKILNASNPDVAAALLPWLENPKWVKEADNGRRDLVIVLGKLQLPESVPGLLAVLREKGEKPANSISSSSNRRSSNFVFDSDSDSINRMIVITALGTQKDSRAVAPLRQLLPELQAYERTFAVSALLACGGFSVDEQVDALEAVAKDFDKVQSDRKQAEAIMANSAQKTVRDEEADDDFETDFTGSGAGNPAVARGDMIAANIASGVPLRQKQPMTAAELESILGYQVAGNREPEEALITATLARITLLDKKDPPTAGALRLIMRRWQGAAINAFLLNDLKNGKIDPEAVVKLLSLRKTLREKQSNEVYDIRSGTPAALGISACLIENDGEYNAILESNSSEAKSAMLACARLIRARLPVQKVAENLKDSDKLLASAAEKYLESEDSSEARSIVLALHPNEAKILGATVYFSEENFLSGYNEFMSELFASIGDEVSSPFYNGYDSFAEIYKTERQLKKEIIQDQNLRGVYAFNKNYIRIFNDKIVFSWEEDKSRYHERTLEANEFEYLKNYLAAQNVDELPPFIGGCQDCTAQELLMLGRQGGRRVFIKAEEKPEFFAGLEKIFTELRQPPARLRYKLEKDVAGLEILYADDNLKARTLWKSGQDLRVLIDNVKQREQIDKEIARQERIAEEAESSDAKDDDDDDEDADYEKSSERQAKLRAQHQYDNYSWQRLADHQLAGAISQPSQVEYLPVHDNLPGIVRQGLWKLRAANLEIRNDDKAIYKMTRGKPVKIADGDYSNLVVTPDGHWLIAAKDDEENVLVRINLLTNQEAAVKKPDRYPLRPVAFISSLNKILVISGYAAFFIDGMQANTNRGGNYYLLDAASGALTPVKGEFRPLLQQTFRPLQPATNPDEFWAAIPNAAKNQTVVGIIILRPWR